MLRTPFSTDGMNWRGIEPPTISSTNSKPPPRGSGSTLSQQSPYWPRPPDWRLYLPCDSALALDGLLVGNLGRLKFNFYIKFPLELLDRDLDMHLAGAGQDDLVGLRVAMGLERGIFLDQALQRLGGFFLVAPGLGPDREGDHRRRLLGQRRKIIGAFSSHSVSPVVVSLSFATATISPGKRRVSGDCFLPSSRSNWPKRSLRAVGRVEHGGVAARVARNHAENRELAGERIDHRLEDKALKRRRGVGRAFDRRRRCRPCP